MHSTLFHNAMALTLAATAVAVSHAQELPLQTPPLIRESAGILYVSGGVGTEDVARMQELAPRFNVRIRFQDKATGASLSDVIVVVLNEKNERLLRLVTEGPLLYMKMQPGRYVLAMAYQDSVQKRTVTIGRAPQNMTLAFPVNEREGAWLYCRDQNVRCTGPDIYPGYNRSVTAGKPSPSSIR
ncbi:hypothetical protein D9M68_269070 [compost metagenome]|uniref:hypothetical protein n=1 Tax=Cupriavidus necator TaxID=106590 RepID=UPI0028B4D3EC